MDISQAILYEDQEIIVIRKPAGIAVESARVTEPDLISLLRGYLPGGVYMVHRLDQPVEGVVLFAKTKKAAAALSEEFRNGTARKLYRARVCGVIPGEKGELTDYLVRDGRSNLTRVVEMSETDRGAHTRGPDKPKKAILRYRRVAEDELEIELLTGRHHQIRAQLAHAGMPIRGDVKYGAPASSCEGLARGQIALLAAELICSRGHFYMRGEDAPVPRQTK